MLKFIGKVMLAIFICGLIILIAWGIHYLDNPQELPVHTVIVQGAPDSTQVEIKKLVNDQLKAGLLTVKLEKIQADLEKMPWVQSAELQRIWPNKLKIILQPQNIVAYWNDKEFLNKYMEVVKIYTDAAIPENLPRLYGPATEAVKAGYYYQILNQVLTPLNLFIIQLQLETNGDITLMLNNGIKIQLGQQHVLTRLNRFVKVYIQVFGGQKDLSGDVVDLRYPSGMAVHWGSK